MPDCTFCGAPDATDVYREELFPDMPCCADENACLERRQRDDDTPQGETVRLFEPAPAQLPGQLDMSGDLPDHTAYSATAAREGRSMNSDEQRADRAERLARAEYGRLARTL